MINSFLFLINVKFPLRTEYKFVWVPIFVLHSETLALELFKREIEMIVTIFYVMVILKRLACQYAVVHADT